MENNQSAESYEKAKEGITFSCFTEDYSCACDGVKELEKLALAEGERMGRQKDLEHCNCCRDDMEKEGRRQAIREVEKEIMDTETIRKYKWISEEKIFSILKQVIGKVEVLE